MGDKDFERRRTRDHVVLAEPLLVPSEPSGRGIRWYTKSHTNSKNSFIQLFLEHFGRRTDEIESYDNEKQARRHADGKDRLSLMQLMNLKDYSWHGISAPQAFREDNKEANVQF